MRDGLHQEGGPGVFEGLPAWAGLNVPATGWQVLAPRYPGPLTEAEMEARIEQAVATRLDQQALAAARRVLFITEDASRPSRTAPVLEKLFRALMPRLPQGATFTLLFAGGAHYGLEQKNITTKAPPGFPGKILTHNCLETVYWGEIDGKPVYLNREIQLADLRIAIGTVNVHPASGYTGGGKILVPGAAGLETIFALHGLPKGIPGETATPMRRFITSVLQHHPVELGLQLIADGRGEVVNLFAGPLEEAWEEAAAFLAPCVSSKLPQPGSLCMASAAPYDQNLLGIFKTLPVLLAAMAENGQGIILIRARDGLGRHHWRLEREVARREKEGWEAQLAGRRVAVVTEARIDAATWQHVFPRQLQAVAPGEINVGQKGKALFLQHAPLLCPELMPN